MGLTDSIADMLTVVRNANAARKEKADVKASKMNEEILKILKRETFISNYKRIADNKQGMIRVYFRFIKGRKSTLNHLERVSTPGLRQYVKAGEVPRVLGGMGIAIISTSSGVLTDKEARHQKVGGELICKVW
ncbi:MAG: 30S ribosomal protein S8 [Candidatus Omnitrophica bacterium]|nr:30S ribosomal protein S8 [Candidatus Omnitrophota bacterium]